MKQIELGDEAFIAGTIALVVALFLVWGISIVEYNEFALEREFGTLYQDIKETGFTWVGFGTLERVNNQIRNYEINIDAASKDMQEIKFDINLNIRIKEDFTYDYLKDYKTEELYLQYLNNKIEEKAKTIIFKYNAEDVLTNRLAISREIFEQISTIKELEYFEINDVALKNIDFSEEYDKILERKAQVDIEKGIIIKQKENLLLQQKNIESINVNDYFKYMLIEKWDGKSALIISDAVLIN